MNYIKNHDQFNEVIKKDKVLIDFYAEWCGPCRMLAPILEKLTDIDVIKVNSDEHGDLAREYGVMSIPSLFFIKDGKIIKNVIGFHSQEELQAIIDELK